MFNDEELELALAVVAAVALSKGDAPGVARALCGRPECAGAAGDEAETTGPVLVREISEQPRAPYAGTVGRASAGRAQTCVIFAVDIAGFTDARRDDEVQLALRRALYGLLIEAFESSGVSWADCVHEDRGDGVIVIVPPGVPAVIMVDPLLHQLRVGLRRHNRLASEVARIGLRVAVHMGQVHRDEHGLAGTAVNHLFRLLDAPVLKGTLAATGSELALVVSDYYYDSVIRQQPSMIESAAFRRVAIRVKQTRCHGWIWTPVVVPDAVQEPAVRWWLMPVGAICTLLWAASALIADAGLDSSSAAQLALGVTVVTGIVIAVTTTALALQVTTHPAVEAVRIPGMEQEGSGGSGRLLRAAHLWAAGGGPGGPDDLDRRAG